MKTRKKIRRKPENHSMSVASTHILSQKLYCSAKFVALLEIPFSLAHVGILSHLVQILQPFKLM